MMNDYLSRSCRRTVPVCMVLGAVWFAQEGVAQPILRASVVASGGAVGQIGGGFLLSGTIGQPVIGTARHGGIRLSHGFWQPATRTSVAPTAEDAINGESLRNFPNPFEETTTIVYTIPVPSHVSLRIYDIKGNAVSALVDNAQFAGTYRLLWNAVDGNGEPVSSGSYLYVLNADPLTGGSGLTERRIMVYIR